MKMILAAALMLSAALFAFAQSGNEMPKNELSVWGGYSPDSTTVISAFGRTPDARFGIVSLRYSRRFRNTSWLNLKYTADVTPLAAIDFKTPGQPAAPRTTAVGFGGAPLGIQANFRASKKVQPYVGMSGGMLYFNKQVLGPLGTHFTFTADIGAGVEIQTRNGRAVSFGYKYFHVSNGNRGEINPGIDNNLLYIGYTFFGK
ncbi:MAG: acyloxyacyl hydrolase [Acidobacteriota bacterium]